MVCAFLLLHNLIFIDMITKNLIKILIFTLVAVSINLSSCKMSSMALEIRELQKAKIFSLSEDKTAIILDGAINNSAYDVFKELYEQNKSVKTINIITCEGSINDVINLKLSKYIFSNGLNIHLMDSGFVASGGTDLFLAGKKRTCGVNTKFGVHSWATEGRKGKLITAMDFPKDHENHKMYIKYYQEVGFSKKAAEDFYFYTIQAAPAQGIHWMTEEEIIKYKMLTE